MEDDIVNRLLCRYPVGPTLPTGEPEFGWRNMGGKMEVTLPIPIMREAAEEIQRLRAELKNKQSDAELERYHGKTAERYEELRDLIDGGSESMTHDDALRLLKEWSDKSWTPVMPPIPPRVPLKLTPNQLASACLSYDHSYGMMEGSERATMMREAAEWWHAFYKELME